MILYRSKILNFNVLVRVILSPLKLTTYMYLLIDWRLTNPKEMHIILFILNKYVYTTVLCMADIFYYFVVKNSILRQITVNINYLVECTLTFILTSLAGLLARISNIRKQSGFEPD